MTGWTDLPSDVQSGLLANRRRMRCAGDPLNTPMTVYLPLGVARFRAGPPRLQFSSLPSFATDGSCLAYGQRRASPLRVFRQCHRRRHPPRPVISVLSLYDGNRGGCLVALRSTWLQHRLPLCACALLSSVPSMGVFRIFDFLFRFSPARRLLGSFLLCPSPCQLPPDGLSILYIFFVGAVGKPFWDMFGHPRKPSPDPDLWSFRKLSHLFKDCLCKWRAHT